MQKTEISHRQLHASCKVLLPLQILFLELIECPEYHKIATKLK